MTIDELVREFRVQTQDHTAPYFFTDDRVRFWLYEAQEEAAIRGRLLHESQDPLICQIAVMPGVTMYSLARGLYELDYVGFRPDGDGQVLPVDLVSPEDLDRIMPGWRQCAGMPCHAIQSDTQIRLVPSPDQGGLLMLEGFRLPHGCGVFEINEVHHRQLVYWALYKAFSLPDADTMDLGRADDALVQFTGYFGLRPDSDLRRSSRSDLPQTVKPYWV